MTKPCPDLRPRLLRTLQCLNSPTFPNVKHLRLEIDGATSELRRIRQEIIEMSFPRLESLRIVHSSLFQLAFNCDNLRSIHIPADFLGCLKDKEQFMTVEHLYLSQFWAGSLEQLSPCFPRLRELDIDGLDVTSYVG